MTERRLYDTFMTNGLYFNEKKYINAKQDIKVVMDHQLDSFEQQA